jgi:hypothetical protein
MGHGDQVALTPEQEAADDAMARALLNAGWDRTTAGSTFGFAHMRRRTEGAHVTTYHIYDEQTVLLHVSNLEQSEGLRGLLVYEDDLNGFLDTLISWQDRLTIDELEASLRDFAAAGYETYRLDGDTAIPVLPP